jgi:hypothetical protein
MMVSRTILSGLALLFHTTTVHSLLLPVGLPDGLYRVPFDTNGTALSEPILLQAVDPATAPSSAVYRRQRGNNPPALPASQSRCGRAGNLNIVQFANAKAQLQAECDRGETFGPRQAVIFTTDNGRTNAYFCNYDASNRCWRQEVEEAMSRLVRDCGSGKGGELYIPQYSKSYGGDNGGQQICRF